jgi:hypothetical protein
MGRDVDWADHGLGEHGAEGIMERDAEWGLAPEFGEDTTGSVGRGEAYGVTSFPNSKVSDARTGNHMVSWKRRTRQLA